MPALLVFAEAPGGPQPAHLVFGEQVDRGFSNGVSLYATLPALRAAVMVGYAAELHLALPALTAAVALQYRSGAPRGPAAATWAPYQEAVAARAYVANPIEQSVRLKSYTEARHEAAAALGAWAQVDMTNTLARAPTALRARHQDAQRAGTWTLTFASQDALRTRQSRRERFQAARRVATWPRRSAWQDMLHDRRPMRVARWQGAAALVKGWTAGHQLAAALPSWRRVRHQDAMKPPAGRWVRLPPVQPPWQPCYLPHGRLVFAHAAPVGPHLVYICDRTEGDVEPIPGRVIVPIRKVYIVLNTVSLRRVADNVEIPVLALSLNIDCDSWTWGFAASLPGGELAQVAPDAGGPIELEAVVNGNAYRVLAERIARERTFGTSTLRVQGRGKSALLAAPYAPARSFTNALMRTAQQLMADVLTDNGVPLGWAIDWQIDDWDVPAGAFAMQAPYMDGLVAIAGAAGAYVQPHATDDTLRVLHRYPDAPWDWGGVTPDFDLPAAVTVQEGIEWTEKPAYNRVYVSGTSHGILGQVTLNGTAGDALAPMATDALITATAAARQRGRAILGDTGRQASVSLRLPVLQQTGVIVPGKYVRYTDNGASRLGLVRSTAVEAGFPEVWQTLQVETHA